MASPIEAFIHEPKGQGRALARRLMDQTLKPDERAHLALVASIMALEEEGLQYPQIAARISLTLTKLTATMRTEKYRLCRQYLAGRQRLDAWHNAEQIAQDRRREERLRWEANGSHALDYYEQAFRRHVVANEKKGVQAGDFVNMDRAERGAQLFAKSAGWTEPVATALKPKELKVGVIQQAMQAIAAADRRETVVRITTTETVEVGRRETATMGGDG